jgi:hypothetical protein
VGGASLEGRSSRSTLPAVRVRITVASEFLLDEIGITDAKQLP